MRDLKESQFGFTLVELIMVLVIIGVLAVFAVPRMFSSNDFYARGFHDEALAYLRFAHKTAVAQRRTVCVSFTASTVSLSMASAAATPTCASSASLAGPRGDTPPLVTARSGVAFGSVPTAFNFDGLGQPVNASGTLLATQTLQVTGATPSITIEAVTGYVHE